MFKPALKAITAGCQTALPSPTVAMPVRPAVPHALTMGHPAAANAGTMVCSTTISSLEPLSAAHTALQASTWEQWAATSVFSVMPAALPAKSPQPPALTALRTC